MYLSEATPTVGYQEKYLGHCCRKKIIILQPYLWPLYINQTSTVRLRMMPRMMVNQTVVLGSKYFVLVTEIRLGLRSIQMVTFIQQIMDQTVDTVSTKHNFKESASNVLSFLNCPFSLTALPRQRCNDVGM